MYAAILPLSHTPSYHDANSFTDTVIQSTHHLRLFCANIDVRFILISFPLLIRCKVNWRCRFFYFRCGKELISNICTDKWRWPEEPSLSLGVNWEPFSQSRFLEKVRTTGPNILSAGMWQIANGSLVETCQRNVQTAQLGNQNFGT
jgi:hypothetical protein